MLQGSGAAKVHNEENIVKIKKKGDLSLYTTGISVSINVLQKRALNTRPRRALSGSEMKLDVAWLLTLNTVAMVIVADVNNRLPIWIPNPCDSVEGLPTELRDAFPALNTLVINLDTIFSYSTYNVPYATPRPGASWGWSTNGPARQLTSPYDPATPTCQGVSVRGSGSAMSDTIESNTITKGHDTENVLLTTSDSWQRSEDVSVPSETSASKTATGAAGTTGATSATSPAGAGKERSSQKPFSAATQSGQTEAETANVAPSTLNKATSSAPAPTTAIGSIDPTTTATVSNTVTDVEALWSFPV